MIAFLVILEYFLTLLNWWMLSSDYHRSPGLNSITTEHIKLMDYLFDSTVDSSTKEEYRLVHLTMINLFDYF